MRYLPRYECAFIVSCMLIATGCDQKPPTPKAPAPSTPIAADNTAANQTDRNGAAKTPLDQGQGADDIRITADLRRAIMDDPAMSMNAQNVKIITDQGIVTLRGVVDTPVEKETIEHKAAAVNGVSRVDNQLTVKG